MTEDDVFKILKEEMDVKNMDSEGQWDSLEQVELLIRFEDEFGEKFKGIPEQEIATMTTPRKVIEVLKKHSLVE